MTIYKCNGCQKAFPAERGLSSHFQHKQLCKSIHYKLDCQNDNLEKKMSSSSNQREQKLLNSNNNQVKNRSKCLIHNDFISKKASAGANTDISNLICKNDNSEILDNNILIDSDETSHNTPQKETETNLNDVILDTTNAFSFHNDERIENNLLKLMQDIGAPNYAFKKIMNWAKDAYDTGYNFNPRYTNYKSQIKKTEEINNLNFLRPLTKHVTLPPDNLELDVTCYDFSSMLCSLLNDTNLNQLSNLVVNTSDPFAKYVSPTGNLGEVNSGYWYQQAYNNLITDPENDFLLPIIFAMDKTSISSSANLHVNVVLFTTSIFKRSIRNQSHAWKPLGYIPIDRNYYTTPQWEGMTSEMKSIRLNILLILYSKASE